MILKGSEGQITDLEVNQLISEKIGAIAKADKIFFVSDLPKTRSGKIMRRILRKIANGENNFGDISTLINPDVVRELQDIYNSKAHFKN